MNTTASHSRRVLHICCMALLLVIANALSIVTPTSAAVTQNDILINTTWNRANSPYLITTTVNVAPGATLTVEPGVEVRFSSGAALVVAGGLDIRGTQAEQVRLIGSDGQRWPGVTLLRPHADVLLQSVTISDATTAVQIQQAGGTGTPKAKVTILDSLLRANTVGIALDNTVADGRPKVSIRNSLLTGNGIGLLATATETNTIKLNHNSFVGNGLGVKVVNGKLRLKQQWWGSELGPLVVANCAALPLERLDPRDAVCGLDSKDYKSWNIVPAGRVLLPAGKSTKLESAVGSGVEADNDDAPTSILTLTVPLGAFTQPVDLSASSRPLVELPAGQLGRTAELGFEITAIAGSQAIHTFANETALQIDITYLPVDLAGLDPTTLGVVAYDENHKIWTRVGIQTSVDQPNQRITARLQHLTRFSVRSVATYSDIALPLVMR